VSSERRADDRPRAPLSERRSDDRPRSIRDVGRTSGDRRPAARSQDRRTDVTGRDRAPFGSRERNAGPARERPSFGSRERTAGDRQRTGGPRSRNSNNAGAGEQRSGSSLRSGLGRSGQGPTRRSDDRTGRDRFGTRGGNDRPQGTRSDGRGPSTTRFDGRGSSAPRSDSRGPSAAHGPAAAHAPRALTHLAVAQVDQVAASGAGVIRSADRAPAGRRAAMGSARSGPVDGLRSRRAAHRLLPTTGQPAPRARAATTKSNTQSQYNLYWLFLMLRTILSTLEHGNPKATQCPYNIAFSTLIGKRS
jgi:hypothetical protein